ncbi:MAG: hypothetical protein V7629_00940 [Motiliproteus sp.]
MLFQSGIMLLFALTVIGCSSSMSMPLVEQSSEPSVIAVRNSTTEHIQQVSFFSSSSGNNAARGGLISPLPIGVMQSIGRGSRAPMLPSQVLISWVNAQGRTINRVISIEDLLNLSTGEAKEVLVFEILNNDQVQVSLEQHVD